jgi:hypothetical protein
MLLNSESTAFGYSFRFFSQEQVDQILREGTKRGRQGSHAAIERILKHEPGLLRVELWQRIRQLKRYPQESTYRRSVWNADDDKILRGGYQHGGRRKQEAIRELLRRHTDWRPHVIWRRAGRLGLIRKATKRRPESHRHRWSENDDGLLLNLAGYKRLRMIAKLLHRSERSVRYRLAVLGKSSRVHVDGYARRALAEQLHLGRRTIQRLIVEGYLEVRDPRITPESLQAVRNSERLTRLQLREEDNEGAYQVGEEQKTVTIEGAENLGSGAGSTTSNSVKVSRAARVWAEVATALNVSLETVKKLIAERTLRLYDPRISERSFIQFCRRYGSLINFEFLDEETRAWLRGSMDLNRNAGTDAAARLSLYRKHARIVRRCTQCGRGIRGNAFFRHIKSCKGSKWSGAKRNFPAGPPKNIRPQIGLQPQFTADRCDSQSRAK